jgi:hypothetical protein
MDTRSPVQHAVVLHRIDPNRGVARFYAILVERDLFGIGLCAAVHSRQQARCGGP